MPNVQRTGLLAGCGLLVIIIVVNASLCFRQIRRLHEDSAAVQRSQDVVNALERVLGALKDAETGQRGYIITGDETYLEPYSAGSAIVNEAIDQVGRLTVQNPFQQERVPRLHEIAKRRLDILARNLSMRKDGGIEGAASGITRGDGKALMDQARALIDEMEGEARRLLLARQEENNRAYRNAVWSCALTVPLGFASVGAFLWLLSKYLKELQIATEKVHEQRELLQATLVSIGDAVIATDADGIVTFLNSIAESLTGWTTAQARGRKLEDVFHIVNEETRAEVENPALRALREGRIFGLANHTVLIARDKTEWPIDDSAAPIRDVSGRIIGAILVFREIQERKLRELELAEQSAALQDANDRKDELVLALQSSEERLRLALNAGRMGVWDWEIPRDHLTWSDQTFAIHGVDPTTFQGKVEDFTRLIHPEDKQRINESIRRAIADNQEYDVEFRIIRPDGEVRWVFTSGQVIYDSNRQPLRMLGATIDTTERKRAEDTFRFLADTSDTLSVLVDYSSTMQKVARQSIPFFCDFCLVYMVNERGEIERVAAAHVSPEQEKILDELQAKYPVTWQSSASPVVEALRTGEPQFVEDITATVIRDANLDPDRLAIIRRLNPRSYISVPLVVRDSRLGCLLLGTADSGRRYKQDDVRIAADLARRAATAVENARLYREVKESARQKDDFIAMLAHELRNPLAAIHYANELTKMPGAMPQEEISEIIGRQTNSLMRLIDDLLDISRITRNKIQLKKEPVDAATVVHRAVDTVRPLVEDRKHHLEVELQPVEMGISADVMRFEQILVNLLSNAAKYTPDGGNIRISAAREDDQVVFRIRDSGIGIDKQSLSQVFDLFMQVGGSLDRAQGGLGIGLTIVRRLVELHGGTVAAASEGTGTGSEFIVRIPLDDSPASVAPSTPLLHAERPLEILVVDDNTDMARSIGLLLTSGGHSVRIAHDAAAAMPLADERRPDAFLLDIGLPGMNGYDLAQHFRREFPDALLVAVSGYGQADDRERSRKAGFNYHLVKPVQHDELMAILAQAHRQPQQH